jgi:hypothetical protein
MRTPSLSKSKSKKSKTVRRPLNSLNDVKLENQEENKMTELSKKEHLMLLDYQSCLATLRHEDGRKSHLFSVFFVIQGVLFGIYGSFVDGNKSGSLWIAGIAFFLSLLWFFAMARIQAFIDLRYVQGEQLERKLKDLTTLRIELSLRNTGVAIVYDEEVRLKFFQRFFSISKHLESLLPIVIGIIWILRVFVFRDF